MNDSGYDEITEARTENNQCKVKELENNIWYQGSNCLRNKICKAEALNVGP